MTPLDDRVLEILQSSGLVLSRSIIAYNLDKSREAVNRRLQELTDYGLVERVYVQTPDELHVRSWDGPLTLDFGNSSINGVPADLDIADHVDTPYTLSVRNGSGVYGSMTLQTPQEGRAAAAITNTDGDQYSVDNVISEAQFDVTYQDAETTYSERVDVAPDYHAELPAANIDYTGTGSADDGSDGDSGDSGDGEDDSEDPFDDPPLDCESETVDMADGTVEVGACDEDLVDEDGPDEDVTRGGGFPDECESQQDALTSMVQSTPVWLPDPANSDEVPTDWYNHCNQLKNGPFEDEWEEAQRYPFNDDDDDDGGSSLGGPQNVETMTVEEYEERTGETLDGEADSDQNRISTTDYGLQQIDDDGDGMATQTVEVVNQQELDEAAAALDEINNDPRVSRADATVDNSGIGPDADDVEDEYDGGSDEGAGSRGG